MRLLYGVCILWEEKNLGGCTVHIGVFLSTESSGEPEAAVPAGEIQVPVTKGNGAPVHEAALSLVLATHCSI